MNKQPCAPLVGADVEQFITLDKEIVPCVGILPGTKQYPYELGRGCFCQEDNVMAEWNIPPCSDELDFVYSVENAQDLTADLLGESGYDLDYSRVSHEFLPEHLVSAQAQLIGCEPDYDAYTGGTMRTDPPPLTHVRNTGGHIHLGGDFKCPDFVSALFAEVFIVVWGRVKPMNTPRQLWYGRPGIFRPKPYGIEYRTLDSSWSWDRDSVESAGYAALRCAKWLTNSDAEEIHHVFRRMPWLEVRAYVENGRACDPNTRGQLLEQIKEAGLEL